MALSSVDQENLSKLGKKCKQNSYGLSILLKPLLQQDRYNFVDVVMMLYDKVFPITSEGKQIIQWSLSFILHVHPTDLREAINFLQKGYEES